MDYSFQDRVNEHERHYTARANGLFLLVLTAHIPGAALAALGFGSNMLIAAAISGLIIAPPALLCYLMPMSRVVSIVIGIASMALSGLLIDLGSGLIEMHFHVFVILSMLVIFGSPAVLIASALTILAHHILFFFFVPGSAFAGHATFSMVLLHALFVFLQLIPGCYIAHRIRRFILAQGTAVRNLGGVSKQLADGVEDLSGLSESLAKSATAQAASVERSGVSIEEIASMTRQNADNAQSAKGLAGEARTAADAGAIDMQAMSNAMDALRAASRGISVIIKTIDEIAFQTNLLSLNAAVEAARAGEAGRGFAVVADEVRSLARRCAAAARETTEKIEDSIRKSDQGVEISGKMGDRLREIVAKVRKVDELVAEIAASSKEQSRGIFDLNKSINEMDHTTEENVGNAERTMATARSLSAQSGQLKETVHTLLVLIGGGSGSKAVEIDAAKDKEEEKGPRSPARALRSAPRRIDDGEFIRSDDGFVPMPSTPPARSAVIAINPSVSQGRMRALDRNPDIELSARDEVPPHSNGANGSNGHRFPMK